MYNEMKNLWGLCSYSLLCMLHPNVREQVGAPQHKVLLAQVAAEGTLPSVGSLVVCQVSPMVDCPGTVRALVMAPAVLQLNVPGQHLFASESEVALFTRIRELPDMAAQVLQQQLTPGIPLISWNYKRYSAQRSRSDRSMRQWPRKVLDSGPPGEKLRHPQRQTSDTTKESTHTVFTTFTAFTFDMFGTEDARAPT